MQSDDRFLLTGYNIGSRNFYLSRHDVNGNKEDINPDPSSLQLDGNIFGPLENDYGHTCLVQSDGKYVVGGYTGTGTIYESGSLQFGLVRYAGLAGEINLPVLLLSFIAEKNNDQVLLLWKTGLEENASAFIIERSATGNAFTAIGNVNARHRNGGDYSFIDPLPLQTTGFYRLKMLDRDGRFIYSRVVAVKPVNSLEKIVVFPNPAIDNIYIQSSGINGNASISIVDAMGKLIKEERLFLSGNNSFSIDIKFLPKGNYYMTIINNVKKQTAMFSKY